MLTSHTHPSNQVAIKPDTPIHISLWLLSLFPVFFLFDFCTHSLPSPPTLALVRYIPLIQGQGDAQSCPCSQASHVKQKEQLCARLATTDRVQTIQTGSLGKKPQRCLHTRGYENNYYNQAWHLCASFTPCPRGIISSRPRGAQRWWADQRQQEGSDTLVRAVLQKLDRL